jgi:hypothetical protein
VRDQQQLPGLELLEEHFKQFNLCLESLNECRAALETNIRVWTAMSNFYSGLVSNKLASDVRKPACWKVQEASFKEYIRQFVAKMRESQKLAQDMLRMIDMMIKIGSWREDTVGRGLSTTAQITARSFPQFVNSMTAYIRSNELCKIGTRK